MGPVSTEISISWSMPRPPDPLWPSLPDGRIAWKKGPAVKGLTKNIFSVKIQIFFSKLVKLR